MRESLDNWATGLTRAEGHDVQAHQIEVSFQSIEDPEEREYFHDVPTSFGLDDETVDRLIEVGRRLLRESPEFQRLLAELETDAAENP